MGKQNYSLFLGMICIDECYFLVFVKQACRAGALLGHQIDKVDSDSVDFMPVNGVNANADDIDNRLDDVRKVENDD